MVKPGQFVIIIIKSFVINVVLERESFIKINMTMITCNRECRKEGGEHQHRHQDQDHNDHLGTCNRERRKEGGERPGAEKKQAAKHLENTGIELFSSD